LGQVSLNARSDTIAGALDADIRCSESVLAIACDHFDFDSAVDCGAKCGLSQSVIIDSDFLWRRTGGTSANVKGAGKVIGHVYGERIGTHTRSAGKHEENCAQKCSGQT
jgi:hypothetical protein